MDQKKIKELYTLLDLSGLRKQAPEGSLNGFRGCGFEFRCTEALPQKRNIILCGSILGHEFFDNPLTIRLYIDIKKTNGCALEYFEYDSDSKKWEAVTDAVGPRIFGELSVF